MSLLGILLKNKRAGETGLAANRAALAGPDTLGLHSADFAHGATLPTDRAGRKAGGQNTSPALHWTGTPEGCAQLLLVVEDVDSPTTDPWVHAVALIDPGLTELPAGALGADGTVHGVRVLRSERTHGYHGPEPIKGHGVHRYVFQLFALPAALTSAEDGAALETAAPREVLAAVSGPVLARGRLDGLYSR
jgi:Raf kinase inhibitor-like YbhB/YbcL family protein